MPEFLGDAMRSAFGRAVKRLACALPRQHDCLPCPLRAACAYGSLYEPLPPTVPVHRSFTEGLPAYVLDPPGLPAPGTLATGDCLSLAVTLLPGHRLSRDLLELAARSAFTGNHGFLAASLTVDTLRVDEVEVPWPSPDPAAVITGHDRPARLHLALETPLALKREGVILADGRQLTGSDLSRLLWRRLQQLCQLTGAPLPDGHYWRDIFLRIHVDAGGLRSTTGWRRDNQGRVKHAVPGLIGTMSLSGSASDLLAARELLEFCRPVHIGRHTVFGLGRYAITDG